MDRSSTPETATAPTRAHRSLWGFRTTVAHGSGFAIRRWELERWNETWVLTLAPYGHELLEHGHGVRHGVAFGWTEPAEFWTKVHLLEPHDVTADDLLDLLLARRDPDLDVLVDGLRTAAG